MARSRWVAALAAVGVLAGGGVTPTAAQPTPPAPTSFNELFNSFPMTVNGTYLPLVGALRCTAAGGDFAIIWYAPGTAADFRWTDFDVTPGGLEHSSAAFPVNGTYEPFVGDFDGDGCDDVFWLAPGPGADFVWYGTADGAFTSRSVAAPDDIPLVGAWDDAVGDDIFWYGAGGGTETIWRGSAVRGTFAAASAPQVTGTDFLTTSHGHGALFYRPGSGADYAWDGIHAGVPTPDLSLAVTINGTYQPSFVSNAGILLYGPGAAPDKLIRNIAPSGALVTLGGTISGTFRVAVGRPTDPTFQFVVFHAPGSAPDYLWTPTVSGAPASSLIEG